MRPLLPALVLASFASVAWAQAPERYPDVPYVPTTDAAVEEMLKLAGVTSADTVYDLGCGDGRIVITAAKKYGAKGVGIDIDPKRIAEARENVAKNGVAKLVRIEQGDLFEAKFSDATVVTLFLLTSVNAKLRPRLLAELKPGTRVVSNTFDMGDWKPDREITVPGSGENDYLSRRLYLWTVPKK